MATRITHTTFSITVDKDVYEKLLAAARTAGLSKKDFIDNILGDYMTAPRPPLPAETPATAAITVTFSHSVTIAVGNKIRAVCEAQSMPARKVLESHLIAHAILQKVAPPPLKKPDFTGVIQRQDKLRRHAAETRRRFKP